MYTQFLDYLYCKCKEIVDLNDTMQDVIILISWN